MFIDTHAHLDFTDDVKGWIERAKLNDVTKIICVDTSVNASRKCVEIAKKYSSTDLQIYATVGIHPDEGKKDIEKFGSLYQCINTIKQLAHSSSKVIAVGETGLNYYLPGNNNNRPETTSKDKIFQRELFGAQIKLADDLALPLIVHCRNGWEEIFDIISKFKVQSSKLSGVFHSWTGDWQAAKKVLDLGFYISFSGIVTFKNAPIVQEVAKKVPLDRILIETDSPFLSPEPYRGGKNEPKNVIITARFLAGLKDIQIDKIGEVTSQNAIKLFGLNGKK